MRTISETELAEILREHKIWLKTSGDEGKRADLGGANLKGANLKDAYLKNANLTGANLECANLRDANLRGANLECANLTGANLECANLEGANLECANLEGANLRDANLECANLSKANLKNANLEGANLSKANLKNANLEGAILKGAYLRDANLRGVDLTNTRIDYQIEQGLLERIARIVIENPDSLETGSWHTCGIVHCIGGWACYLSAKGKELEEEYGTQIAGLLLLGAEAHSHFFDRNEGARNYLETVLERANNEI